jgi:hypothetical protein
MLPKKEGNKPTRLALDGSVNRGKQAYMHRMIYRCSWCEVATHVGYADHKGAWKMAKRYAKANNLPWPVEEKQKGAVIYTARRYKVSWLALSRIYDQTIAAVQRCAYKWSKRREKPWPPEPH